MGLLDHCDYLNQVHSEVRVELVVLGHERRWEPGAERQMDEHEEGNTVDILLASRKPNENVLPVWGRDTQSQMVRKWEREH
jgi:hypothetical protein